MLYCEHRRRDDERHAGDRAEHTHEFERREAALTENVRVLWVAKRRCDASDVRPEDDTLVLESATQ